MSRQGIFRRAGALLGAVVVSGALAAGCGGGGDNAPPSPLTKAQFVKRADAICQKMNEEKEPRLLTAVRQAGGLPATSKGELERLGSQVVLPLYEETISRLRRLKPPPKDKAKVAKILAGYEAALKKAEANPSTALNGNPFLKTDEATIAYGFECGL